METFTILAGNQIDRQKISEAIQLDRISYDDVYQLQVDTCISYFEQNNDIYIMAVDNKSGGVIGYINFSPVKESVFAEMISGCVIDTVITSKDVLPYQNEGMYWGYFSSIVVHPAFRQQGVATQMLHYWSDLIFRLAVERNIYFKEIVADAVSGVGVLLLSEIGFSFARSSLHDSKIMTLNFFAEDVVQSKFNEKVLNVYRQYKGKDGKSDAI